LIYENFTALQQEPLATNTALRLASDLTITELNTSAVARNSISMQHLKATTTAIRITALPG
jgi:hypothetical protein